MQNVLSKRNVKMGALLTLEPAPVLVQEAIQGNIAKVRVLRLICLYTMQTTYTVLYIYIIYIQYIYIYIYIPYNWKYWRSFYFGGLAV